MTKIRFEKRNGEEVVGTYTHEIGESTVAQGLPISEAFELWDGCGMYIDSDIVFGIGTFKCDFKLGNKSYRFSWVNTEGNGYFAMLDEFDENGAKNSYHHDRNHKGDLLEARRWKNLDQKDNDEMEVIYTV